MSPIDTTSPMGVTLALLPEVVLSLAALGVLLVNAWRHETAADSRLAGWLSLGGVAASLVSLAWLAGTASDTAGIPQMVALDGYRYVGNLIFLLAAAATILLSLDYLEREEIRGPEYYTLVLLATAGMMLLGGANDLIMVFLGLEVMSVAAYVLAAYDRRSPFSAEAGLKYFLIGAFASGFLLYGIALVYGATGTTNLVMAGTFFERELPVMAALGLCLLLIGFLFKVSVVPFHMWAPDVYDGAPTPVTGLMATGIKAAGFLALTRLLFVTFPANAELWQPVLGILAILTMVAGNLMALAPRTVKRMLAYSSVAHAGYILAAVWSGTRLGAGAVLAYLLAYSLTSLAAFGLLAALGRGGERDLTADHLSGLAKSRPWSALAFSVVLLSLLGFPGTFGFIGKWMILSSLVVAGQWIIPVVLVLASAVSAGYYLPLIMAMHMKPAPERAGEAPRLPRATAVVVAVIVAAILVVGVWPGPVLSGTLNVASSLFERAFQ